MINLILKKIIYYGFKKFILKNNLNFKKNN